MFDDFTDWIINSLGLNEKLELMGSEKLARDLYDKFIDDWAIECDVPHREMTTSEMDDFEFGYLRYELERDVMTTLKAMSPSDVVELQVQWADVFEDMDLSPIQSQLLTGKLLRDLSEKPEKVLVKI